MGSNYVSGNDDEEEVEIQEGWLYHIRSNRIGFQYSRKRYFVLQHHLLNTFRSLPHYSHNKDPIRSLAINSSTRVTDNGSESIQRKVFFVFTLYNTCNNDIHMKLGASSPEEAARWIQSFREAILKADLNSGNPVDCPKTEWQYASKAHGTSSLDSTNGSASPTDPMTTDAVSPSTWTIFGCHNGLRLFKEVKDRETVGKSSNYPAIMAVGVVDATAETIFETFMSLDFSRSEWDFCFHRGTIIEHIDDHADIIHKQLYGHWLNRGMKRRDLLLHRYWRREEDGTYVILYQSVLHKKCPPQKGYVRASLKSGGYVITPSSQGEQSVVKHMLAIDWKLRWKPYLKTSSAQSITIRMLGRLSALRELFSTNPVRYSSYTSSEFTSRELSRELVSDKMLHRADKTLIVETQKIVENGETEELEDDLVESPDYHSCRVGLDDDADELFHSSVPRDYDKRTVHKRGYTDLDGMMREDDGVSCSFGTTLPQDPTGNNLRHSWSAGDPSMFQVRGKTYPQDGKKIKAQGTLMQMVGVDWLRTNKREDDLAGRRGSIVQEFAANGRPEFFLIVNMQIPGYGIVYYLMLSAPVEDTPLLASFINGDDAYRNSRFKITSFLSKAPWIVKQSIGKKPCLLGQSLRVNYVRGRNYLELDIDVGASAIARSIAGMVMSYLSNVVHETAFVIQGNTEEELPEYLLGTFQLNHLDVNKAFWVKP